MSTLFAQAFCPSIKDKYGFHSFSFMYQVYLQYPPALISYRHSYMYHYFMLVLFLKVTEEKYYILNPSTLQINRAAYANSVDPDETIHHKKPSGQDLYCLLFRCFCLFCFSLD